VEKIVAKRVNSLGTEYEYKVRWEGVDASGDSWVAKSEIGKDVLAGFERASK
jgi:hypothetical protein